jgi:hypothetical protein
MLFSPQILSRSQPRVVTASAYVGPGDIVSSAFAWWGLRGYTAAYSTGSNPALDLVDQAGANQLTVNILSGTTTASIAATDATWHAAQAVFNDHVVRRLRGWIVNDRSFCGAPTTLQALLFKSAAWRSPTISTVAMQNGAVLLKLIIAL